MGGSPLQARMSAADSRLYNPNRDLAHCFDQVIQEVAARCEGQNWRAMNTLLEEKKVTPAQLGQCCEALCRFIISETDVTKESMAQGLARCGFLDLPEYARLAVMAHMGTVVLGMHWAGVRDATLGGIGPVLTYQKLRWYGRHCALLMRLPRWRRSLINLRTRWRRAKAAFFRLY